ncbi:hypothetical protein EJB05_36809, partial [Eragrostis curvula]
MAEEQPGSRALAREAATPAEVNSVSVAAVQPVVLELHQAAAESASAAAEQPVQRVPAESIQAAAAAALPVQQVEAAAALPVQQMEAVAAAPRDQQVEATEGDSRESLAATRDGGDVNGADGGESSNGSGGLPPGAAAAMVTATAPSNPPPGVAYVEHVYVAARSMQMEINIRLVQEQPVPSGHNVTTEPSFQNPPRPKGSAGKPFSWSFDPDGG